MRRFLPAYLALFGAWLMSAFAASAATGFAGEFLAVGAGARGLALGSAYVALVDDATAGYWNPAALTSAKSEIHLMHAERFNGLVDQDFVAVRFDAPFTDGASLSLLRLGVGDIAFTTLPNPAAPLGPDNRPLVSSTESSADYAMYLSGGRRLSDRLDVGISGKLIYRTVASFSAYGAGIDLGLRYRLGSGLVFAANLRDLTTTPIVWEGGTDRIEPSANIGLAYTHTVAGGQASLLMASRSGGDASDDAGTTPVNAGIEYQHSGLTLRAGIAEERQTFGLGLRPHARLGIDLAYLQHEDLEDTYLLSARIGF